MLKYIIIECVGEASYPALKCGASPVPSAFSARFNTGVKGWLTTAPSRRTRYPLGYLP
ncbi:hypothetical protein [Archaeoglobus sp.]